MALRDLPYIPLYVQDFITDEKLCECTAESTGVYIRLMCLLHKSEEYGTLLLKQKDKQNSSTIKNFASKLVKFMPYPDFVIERSLEDLFSNGVIQIEGDKLSQKRMVRDNYLSEVRSKAGKKGGQKTGICLSKNASKSEANPENENDNIIINNNIKSNKGGTGGEERGNPPDEHIKKKDELPEGFKEFWDKYPRHVGKQAAIRAFKKIKKSQLPVVMAGLDKAIKSPEWQRNIKNGTLEYIPHASTWVHGLRWEDETTPSAQQPEKKEQQAWERLPWPPDLIKQNPYYAKNCIDHVMRKKLKDFYAAHGIDIERANKEDYL